MSILQSLILGIVQGLTELLPISSSGHLEIIPWLFNWTSDPNFSAAFEGFDVALHFGTFLAIAIFFFKDWINLIVGGFNQVVKKKKTPEGRMFWYLVIATIPGGIDFEEANKNNIKAELALGLPGKYAPYTTAKFIKDVIEELCK